MALLFTAAAASAEPSKLSHALPQSVGMSGDHLRLIDQAVAEGLEAKLMPGCVVLIGRHGKVVHFQAYGNRRVEPDTLPMTRDTVFDMASITKPVATATSMMSCWTAAASA
ncbi:MAG: serine hydrolase [Planctomycetes bacterium]|nr:serine hydrolase [Planctomycetota bacterium]